MKEPESYQQTRLRFHQFTRQRSEKLGRHWIIKVRLEAFRIRGDRLNTHDLTTLSLDKLSCHSIRSVPVLSSAHVSSNPLLLPPVAQKARHKNLQNWAGLWPRTKSEPRRDRTVPRSLAATFQHQSHGLRQQLRSKWHKGFAVRAITSKQ